MIQPPDSSQSHRSTSERHLPDWHAIDVVLLDMDGTLLDLGFDSYFWLELLPQRYAEAQGLSLHAAREHLTPLLAAHAGTLNWYCLDYWSEHLGLDIVALKHQVAHRIRWLPGAQRFLEQLAMLGKRRVLATNAHRASVGLKLERTGLGAHVEAVHSAHDFGHPKESQAFWHALGAREHFDPARTLFVDDSIAVLRAAHVFGVHSVAISRPVLGGEIREMGNEFAQVSGVGQLLGAL